MFYGAIEHPKVLISDQGAGLRKAFMDSPTWAGIGVYHQLCGWHMVQNIKAFVVHNRRHLLAADLQSTWTAFWALVQAPLHDLAARKSDLFALLEPCEIQYYHENWDLEKERRVLEAYTSQYQNLGLRSTSLNKGQNFVRKTFIDHKMNLEQATKELIRSIVDQDRHDEVRNAESRTKRYQPATAGMQGLHELQSVITRTAIDLLKPEMHAAQSLYANGILNTLIGDMNTPCRNLCRNPTSFGLPCRHTLQILVSENKSVPRTLIHPRWFIDPSDATPDHDLEGEHTFFEHYLVGGGEVLLSAELLHTEIFRSSLPLDEAEQFAVRYQGLAQDLRTEYTPLPATTATTIAFPPPPKLTKHAEDLRRKAHGRAMQRLPTVAELADIEVRKRKHTLTHSEVPPSSSAPARLHVSTLHPLRKKRSFSTLQLKADTTTLDSLSVYSSDLVFIDDNDTQSEIQYIDEIEEQWLRNRGEFPSPGHGSQSTSQVIDLCEVDTQDRQCIEDYAEKRVVPMVDLCSLSNDKDNKEEEKEQDGPVPGEKESIESTSQLSWHSELDTQATVLL